MQYLHEKITWRDHNSPECPLPTPTRCTPFAILLQFHLHDLFYNKSTFASNDFDSSMFVQIVWQTFLQDAQHIFPATIVKNNTISLITPLADLLCGRTEALLAFCFHHDFWQYMQPFIIQGNLSGVAAIYIYVSYIYHAREWVMVW